jgi:hypothetical protein
LSAHNVKGTVLCALPSGSRLHGLSHAASSVDWIGIFAAPTTRMFWISPPPKTVDDRGVDSTAANTITYTRGGLLLELNFACALLRQGNLRLVRWRRCLCKQQALTLHRSSNCSLRRMMQS